MYECKCCGHETLPVPPEEAIAYICPICRWENDVFTADDDEPSDENHGISLNRARKNYIAHGICDPRLKEQRGPAMPGELLTEIRNSLPLSEENPIIGGSYCRTTAESGKKTTT